jgi:hypothetical protein
VTTIILDQSPDYIPFIVACTKADGTKINPTVDNLIIYDEDGGDASWSSSQITGSPFDPVQVNSKTGLWGILVPKSALTVGHYYIALWEMTVDGIATHKVERYFVRDSDAGMVQYINGKADYNIASVAVPARNVEVGMLDTIDIYISASQKLHVELTYNTDRHVVSKDFTVI